MAKDQDTREGAEGPASAFRRRLGRSRRPLLAALAIAGLAIGVAACGNGSDDGTSDGKIVIRVLASRDPYLPDFSAFEKEHPNIIVKTDVEDDDKQLQALQREKAANQTMPDLVHDDASQTPAYVAAGLVIPINDLVDRWKKEDPDNYNKLLPSVFTEPTYDGKIYGAALTANFDVYYYNIPMFKQAGIQVPFKTFDDMQAGIQKLHEAFPDKTALVVQAKPDEGVTTLKTMFNYTGVPWDGAIPDMSSDGGLYTLNFFLQARASGAINKEAIAWGEDETRGLFLRGDGGMIQDGVQAASDFNADKSFQYGKQWGIMPIPLETGQGQTGTPVSAARTWGITTGSKHPYEASLVLRYMAETDNLVYVALRGASPPRSTAVLGDPRYQKFDPFFKGQLVKEFMDAEPEHAGPNAGEAETTMTKMWDEIVNGTDKSAQDLVDEYQPQLDELK